MEIGAAEDFADGFRTTPTCAAPDWLNSSDQNRIRQVTTITMLTNQSGQIPRSTRKHGHYYLVVPH